MTDSPAGRHGPTASRRYGATRLISGAVKGVSSGRRTRNPAKTASTHGKLPSHVDHFSGGDGEGEVHSLRARECTEWRSLRWPGGRRWKPGAFSERPVPGPVIPVSYTLVLFWRPCLAPGTLMVNAGTGWPGGNVLPLGEMASLSCHFCLSVAAYSIVEAHPSLIYASMLSGR